MSLDKVTPKIVRSFYSVPQISVTLTTAGADIDLPNVILPNIAGTILEVYVGVKFRMMENTNAAANKLSGAQNIRIKKSTGTYGVDDLAAIALVDDLWGLAASTREGGDVVVGAADVAAEVDAFNATYNMRFENAVTDQNNLVLYDVQTFLIVTYRL